MEREKYYGHYFGCDNKNNYANWNVKFYIKHFSGGAVTHLMNLTTIDLDEPTLDDLKWVQDMIGEFVKETESTLGKRILDNWQEEHAHFVKVKFWLEFITVIVLF